MRQTTSGQVALLIHVEGWDLVAMGTGTRRQVRVVRKLEEGVWCTEECVRDSPSINH